MTLVKQLRQKLSESPAGVGRREFQIADEASGWSVYLTTDHQDQWTSVVWELALRRDRNVGALADWAQRIVGSAGSGLLEPLKVIEIDSVRDQALLRSDAPSAAGDTRAYYELVLSGTTAARMRRYQGVVGSGKREQTPFVLTNEALLKLLGDLIA